MCHRQVVDGSRDGVNNVLLEIATAAAWLKLERLVIFESLDDARRSGISSDHPRTVNGKIVTIALQFM